MAGGLFEIREYTCKPEGLAAYVKATEEAGELRKSLLPLLGMFTCETGSTLHKVTHIYHYKDLDERDRLRGAAVKDERWKAYIGAGRVHMQHQTSKIMSPATGIYTALDLPPSQEYKSGQAAPGTKPVYELRTYQLRPGYGSVPELVEAFKKGLGSKIAADAEGSPVLFAYSEVGLLNEVVELWRYPSAQACLKAREASRTVPAWRETIASIAPGVQSFSSAFLTPMKLSPWQ